MSRTNPDGSCRVSPPAVYFLHHALIEAPLPGMTADYTACSVATRQLVVAITRRRFPIGRRITNSHSVVEYAAA